MKQPLISVIITVLNGAKTIQQCLDSIANQSFSNLEVVIVDGGSIDGTLSIIEKSLVVNKTVRVLPGIGLYAGLNEGVRLANGQWFYFMGSDDKLHEYTTFQKVVDVVSSISEEFMVVAGNVQYIKQDFVFRPQLGSPYWLRYHVHHQGLFYRREVFDDLQYDESLFISSDYELNLKLALRKVLHKFMDVIVCDIGEDGISNTQIERSTAEIHEIHKRLFSGISRPWVVNYFRLHRAITMTRRRLNLVNLKVRFRRFIDV